MGKVKIKPIEEVYLELRADWDNPETFREIADRILEKEHGIQVTISGEPEITYQGEGLPNLVEYARVLVTVSYDTPPVQIGGFSGWRVSERFGGRG